MWFSMTGGLRSDPSGCACSHERCDFRDIYNCLSIRKTEFPSADVTLLPLCQQAALWPSAETELLWWLGMVTGWGRAQPGETQALQMNVRGIPLGLWQGDFRSQYPWGLPIWCVFLRWPRGLRLDPHNSTQPEAPSVRGETLKGILKDNTQQCTHSSRAYLTTTVTLGY